MLLIFFYVTQKLNFVPFNNFVKLLETWGGGGKVGAGPSITPLAFFRLHLTRGSGGVWVQVRVFRWGAEVFSGGGGGGSKGANIRGIEGEQRGKR